MGKKKYELRKPRYAGGIRLQTPRGVTPGAWWATRWQEALACKSLENRFGRGRVYALSGQVVELALHGNICEARVVGVREEPYCVKIVFRRPEGEARERIAAALRAEPMLVARMLAGELPSAVEGLFRAEGCELFPGGKLGPGQYDMRTSCSCPDYANPCKHAFAALLVLGEEISRRPATLLELRGFTMAELMR